MPDVVLDRRGHLADQPVRDVDAVQLAQVPLDLPRRHPAGVQGEDLLVEAVEGTGVLGHDPRLEARVAITGQLDRDRPVDGAQRLRRRPVPPVRLLLRRLRARPVAEVLLELGTGRPLDQTLAQPVDQSVRAGQLLRPRVLPQQLIDQLVRDLLHLAHQCVSFRAARPDRSARGYAASLTTGPDRPVRYTEIRALPARWTRRLSSSMKKSTYRRCSVIVSTVKKATASMLFCLRPQESSPRECGSRADRAEPSLAMIFFTVVAETVRPRPFSSPTIRW